MCDIELVLEKTSVRQQTCSVSVVCTMTMVFYVFNT